MDQPRLLNYMCAALTKNFGAVLQVLRGDLAVPICDPPTALLDVSVQLCSGSCWKWPRLLECCDNDYCQNDGREHGKKLTLLSAACLDGRYTQWKGGAALPEEMDAQGAIIALLLLAGSDAFEGAHDLCGVCYQDAGDPVVYSGQDLFPRAVLEACTVPAVQRAANWPRVLNLLSKAESKEACMKLTKTLFLQLCCEGVPSTFFEEAEEEARE